MFVKNTVLVLGAGASKPYGFPLGSELVDWILARSQYLSKDLENQTGYNKKSIDSLCKDLKESACTSIDAFLEHRPDDHDLGKRLIACSLLSFEREVDLYTKRDWYSLLLEKMNAPFDELKNNKLSIVTFNYDRSLEAFLFRALKSRHPDRQTDEIREVLDAIPIVHVHGQLGLLQWQATNGRKGPVNFYGTPVDWDSVEKAASTIKIVSQNFDDDKELRQARQLLDDAEIILFLGFGFHPQNVERLRCGNVNKNKMKDDGAIVKASLFKLTPAEREHIYCNLVRLNGYDERMDKPALDFLRDTREFLGAAT